MVEDMTSPVATERYRSTIETYKKLLAKNPSLRLRPLCRKLHVDYYSMARWMCRQGISVKELQRSARADISAKGEDAAAGFVAVVPMQPCPAQESDLHDGMLSDVSLTFSDGTVVSISKCTPSSVISLLVQYRKEVARCSD